jgi:hypothetical protein
MKTPSIKIEKIDRDRNISGRSMFKLLIIYFVPYLKLNLFDN